MAEEAHALASFDLAEAKKALQEAQSLLSSAGDEAAKAEAQIAVDVAESIVKAIE